jgi:DNA polymerase III sliding clamp (beta) subunit (PCNA family)
MKLDTKTLRAALNDLSAVIKTRTTLPAYECVNFVPDASGVKLQATDGQAWMSRAMAAEKPVAFMVSFSLLNQLIARVESESIEFKVEGSFVTLEMGCTRRLRCVSADLFPEFYTSKGTGIGCNTSDLGDSIAAVAWAVSRDTNLDMHKRCVLVDLSALEMACAATRGTSMAVQQLKSICEPRQFYILGEYAQVFADVCREPEAEVFTVDNMIGVESSLTTLYVIQPHAQVWDWKKYVSLAAQSAPTSIPRSILMRNCHDAIVMGGMDKNIVPRISLETMTGANAGKIRITTTGTDGNIGEFIFIPDPISDGLDINIPPQQLLEFCQHVSGEKIICRSKPNAAFFECGDLTAIIAQCPRSKN